MSFYDPEREYGRIPSTTCSRQKRYFLSLAEIKRNAPIIASRLYFETTNQKAEFDFIRFLSTEQNNSVVLVRDRDRKANNSFIIKHISVDQIHNPCEASRETEVHQNYPQTFTCLRSIRQATLDETMLLFKEENIGVIPVVSCSKLAAVKVEGMPYEEEALSFFKMAPFVNGQTVQKAMNQLTDAEFEWIIKQIAHYLARLHTFFPPSQKVEFCEKTSCITTAHTHKHPHFRNWIFDGKYLYLIDFDQYSDCYASSYSSEIHLKDLNGNDSLREDISKPILNIPEKYIHLRKKFKEQYLFVFLEAVYKQHE